MPGMLFYGLLFPSLRIHLFTDRTNPGSSYPTLIRSSLVCGVIFIFIWLILVLFLSLFCHPTHPYLLSPHFYFRLTHQFTAIVSHLIHSIFISPYVYYWVWSVRKTCPKSCMYITSVVCCWHSPDLKSTWISLPPVSSTATLGLFLLITQLPDLDLLFLCVFVALRRKPAHRVSPSLPTSSYWVFMALRRKPVRYKRVLAVSLGVRGSSIPTTTWGVLVCTCRHRYGTG